MKRSNRNFLLAYLLLVALPVLGLVGVLRSGRNVTAPAAIGGVWKLQANTDPAANFGCGKPLTAEDAAFTISQSGQTFTLSLVNSPMASASGVIDGTTVKAVLMPGAAGLGACSHRLVLTAMIDTRVDARSMQGKVSLDDCPDCSVIEFHALREPARGGH
jgi:hypothetical protein